jgi:hypothetical protein
LEAEQQLLQTRFGESRRARDAAEARLTAQRQALHERFPDALVFDMPKSSAGRAWDYKWTGSHRYGLLHLGASDWVHFEARAREASVLLGWPTRVARRQDAGTP